MKLPWKCERCGTSNSHYGLCVATAECLEIANTKNSMRRLLNLAREINPNLPPDAELEDKIVTITMGSDFIGASYEQR